MTQIQYRFFPLILIISWNVFAGQVDDAVDSLGRARNEYYKAYRDRKNQTPEEADRLYKQMVEPARKKVHEAMDSEFKETLKRLGVNEDGSPKKRKGVQKIQKGGDQKLLVPSPSEPSKPEVVLDGSNVPQEIEFPGKKPSPIPKLMPSPSPLPKPSKKQK